MKRTVTGPNGIMVVYGNEHLSDDELRAMAARLAHEQAEVIQQMRQQLYGYRVRRTDEEEFGSAELESFDDLGADVARSYDVSYGGVSRPARENFLVFTIDDTYFRVHISASRQAMRDELTGLLRRRGRRPKE